MNKEIQTEVLTSLFLTLSIKKKKVLLQEFFSNTSSNQDRIIDYMLHKPITALTLDARVGDMVYLDVARVYSWPEIDKDYYKKHNLLINNTKIKVKIVSLKITESYICVEVFTKNSKFEKMSYSESYFSKIEPIEEIFEL